MSAQTTSQAASTPDPEATSRRVEELLNVLAEHPDPAARAQAEELVRVLMDFYGAGLARVVELSAQPPAPSGPLARLLSDELVAGLLVLHDLHPDDVTTRIHHALDQLPGNTLRFSGFDEQTGVLRLRPVESSGSSCPSTQQAATQRVRAALACVAPEVAQVELELTEGEQKPEPVLMQIGTRPPGSAS